MCYDFLINEPYWVTPEFAKSQIQNAWLGQHSSTSYISQIIRYGTQGAHSHSSMFVRYGTETSPQVDILEVREFKGGQRRTLEYHMRQIDRIDVFSPNIARWPEFDPVCAVDAMRRLTDEEYGWWGIWQMFARRVPGLWRMYNITTDDRLPEPGQPIVQPYCSHAVSLATHCGGGVDPVPRCPHHMVSPGMLTNSLFYCYEFTIASPACVRQYGDQILTAAAANEQVYVRT